MFAGFQERARGIVSRSDCAPKLRSRRMVIRIVTALPWTWPGNTMSSVIANPIFRNLLRGIIVWAPMWIGTTVLFGTLGLVFVLFFKQDVYLASQAIMVRDEAGGALMRLGRFQTQAEMKAAQETILEMAKSHLVVRQALETVGPEPQGMSWGLSWGNEESVFPSTRQIEETATRAIAVHAPKGVEFGVTEVIYIDVSSDSQSRSLELNNALCTALEERLQQVRCARADSVIAELMHARDSAHRELNAATDALQEREQAAGADLSDLRGMTDMIAGGSSARLEFDQIKNELRQTEQMEQQLSSDRELLLQAIQDPTSFVVAPSSLLNSQPGLKRLREGLVDAQLSGSQLTGKFTEVHPLVIASKAAQGSIVQRFTQELKASLASVEADLSVVAGKRARLESQKDVLDQRLSHLADHRAQYANLAADVKSRLSILEAAERELAAATAARDSSKSTSLLTRLDKPIVNDKPLGPGKTTLLAICGMAGLAFGLGIVFLITPIDAGPTVGRRISDRLYGRRANDTEETFRRASDGLASPQRSANTVRPAPSPVAEGATLSPQIDAAFQEMVRGATATSEPKALDPWLHTRKTDSNSDWSHSAIERVQPRAAVTLPAMQSAAQQAAQSSAQLPSGPK